MEVDVYKDVFFLGLRGFGKEFALWTCHEAGAPELDAVGLTAGIGLMPYPINSNDGETIGNGMTTLHELPGLTLAGLLLRGVAGFVTDGGGINEDVGSGKGHQAGTFWIPLVPANLNTEVAHGGLDGVKTEVARGEIELLIVGGVVGDVHLAMNACDAAVFLENDSGIVVKARGTTLEKTGDEDNRMLAGKGSKEVGGRTRNGFCKVKVVDGFYLAEIGGIMEFLQDNELGALSSHVGNGGGEARAVIFWVRGAGLLNKSYFHREGIELKMRPWKGFLGDEIAERSKKGGRG